MNIRLWVFSIFSLAMGFACDSTPAEEGAAQETAVEAAVNTFGEEVNAEGAIGLDQVAAIFEEQDSARIKITARVEEVCQKKGCWMNLVPESENGQAMMVRFKDYGFFVPKDIAGRTVVVEGMAYRETVSVEDLRHYAQDKGESPEAIAAITQPEEKISFLADGVLLLEPASAE